MMELLLELMLEPKLEIMLSKDVKLSKNFKSQRIKHPDYGGGLQKNKLT